MTYRLVRYDTGTVLWLQPGLLTDHGAFSLQDDHWMTGKHAFVCLHAAHHLWTPLSSRPGAGRRRLDMTGAYGETWWLSGIWHFHPAGIWHCPATAVAAGAAAHISHGYANGLPPAALPVISRDGKRLTADYPRPQARAVTHS